MTSQIPNWRTASTFEPQLVVTTPSPVPVMTAMRAELERAGYKVTESTSAHVRLRYIDWFAMAAQDWARTVVGLTQHADRVLIEVESGSSKRKASGKAHEALNAAVAALAAQGVSIEIGEWQQAD
jgi:hypothetical protein